MAAREQSGIYTISHVASGRLYVGQSQRLRRRLTEHRTRLRAGNHVNAKLQAAFDKYGEQEFAFEVLVECAVNELDAQEQYWINMLDPAYNLAPVVGGIRGYRFTEQQRQNLRAAFADPETKRRRSEARKAVWDRPGFREAGAEKSRIAATGKKQTPETIAKRTAWQAGRTRDADFCAKVSAGKLASGFKFTEESRRKMSEAARGRKQSPETVAKRLATIAANKAKATHGA